MGGHIFASHMHRFELSTRFTIACRACAVVHAQMARFHLLHRVWAVVLSATPMGALRSVSMCVMRCRSCASIDKETRFWVGRCIASRIQTAVALVNRRLLCLFFFFWFTVNIERRPLRSVQPARSAPFVLRATISMHPTTTTISHGLVRCCANSRRAPADKHKRTAHVNLFEHSLHSHDTYLPRMNCIPRHH